MKVYGLHKLMAEYFKCAPNSLANMKSRNNDKYKLILKCYKERDIPKSEAEKAIWDIKLSDKDILDAVATKQKMVEGIRGL